MTSEGDDGDDGSEDTIEPADLTHEDLSLLTDAAEADAAARAALVPETAADYDLPPVENYDWSESDKSAALPFLEVFKELDLPLGASRQDPRQIRAEGG